VLSLRSYRGFRVSRQLAFGHFAGHIDRAGLLQVGDAELSGARITLVIGTRPEAIKLAPVAHALAAHGAPPSLILTGQHPGLVLGDHGLGGYIATRLACIGQDDPRVHADSVAAAVAELLRTPPDLLVVQGDTSSALGGALAASEAGVPIAHVEAGLRSFDPAMPWPEEDNRVSIDAVADLLFAPTETSAANLRHEAVGGAIHVTGNSGIDALVATLGSLPASRPRRRGAPPLILVTCHRRENWGVGLTSVERALIAIARSMRTRIECVLHPNPAVRGSMHLLLDHEPGIRLVEPYCHRAMIAAMQGADLILSDSGGVQEEAPALGVPLLVLREKTERPEGVASGNMVLVGTGTAAIVRQVTHLLSDREALAAMARPAWPFGDGRAGPRIAGHMLDWIAARGEDAARRRA
jgi:UDP-N-acetylglucosamine 2-epimerase (non-hydrolysing)